MFNNERLLIAEIGGNHGGDKELAFELGMEAINCGATHAKYQILTADTLINKTLSRERYNHFKRLTLTERDYKEIAEKLINEGGKFNASIWNVASIDMFADYMDFYKIGSGDLTCKEIVKRVISIGKPILLSTGLTDNSELLDIVEFIRRDKKYREYGMLGIMQCTSLYPCPESAANLNNIDTIKSQFGSEVSIGYSHHCLEVDTLELAYVKGAKILEFHYTDDRDKEGFRDHQLSLDKFYLPQLIKNLDRLDTILGSHKIRVTNEEKDVKHPEEFRRAVYFQQNLKKGHLVEESDLISLRPCKGIPANLFFSLVGKRLSQDVVALMPLNEDMFDD